MCHICARSEVSMIKTVAKEGCPLMTMAIHDSIESVTLMPNEPKNQMNGLYGDASYNSMKPKQIVTFLLAQLVLEVMFTETITTQS